MGINRAGKRAFVDLYNNKPVDNAFKRCFIEE